MNTNWKISGISIAILGVCTFLLIWEPDNRFPDQQTRKLVLYCAAGIKQPVEEVAREYEHTFNVSIQLQYGGSGTLLSNMVISQTGDLYLAADQSYLDIAREKNLVEESIPLAHLRPVIGVRKGNPKNVQSIEDLLRDDVRVGLANPDAASIGKQTRSILEQIGQWDKIEKVVKVFKPTVTDIANDIKLGIIDAGFIWDATANQSEEIDFVAIPSFDAAVSEIAIAVLKSCQNPPAALRFCRYLGACDRGLKVFKKWGFEPVIGDVWEEKPELLLFSGGVNRLAIQNTIEDFQKREGVKVTTVYNGCGILVAQMKAGERPDAYFACDVSFMNQVAGMFTEAQEISQTKMVILVSKGNPRNIKSLRDLTASGITIGVANAKQSALGSLTKVLLEEMGIYREIMKNVRSQTPTADLLVNQMLAGSLDAVIVYEANTSKVKTSLDIIAIDHKAAYAVQPIAVSKETKYPQLTSRLLRTVRSDKSREQFKAVGFDWRVK